MPETPSGTPIPSSSEAHFHFSDMHLQAGDRLQVLCPSHAGKPRHIVKLIGYVDDVGMLITTPVKNGVVQEFVENEIVVVRAFSRQKAFAFKCTVNRVCKLPFDYLHLSFPDRIQGSIVRNSARVKAEYDAAVTRPDQPSDAPASAVIENISATGALLRSSEALGDKDATLRLKFAVTLHDVVSELSINAIIHGALPAEEGACRYGIEFQDLPPTDSMILRGLIYQQMIENPRSLV